MAFFSWISCFALFASLQSVLSTTCSTFQQRCTLVDGHPAVKNGTSNILLRPGAPHYYQVTLDPANLTDVTFSLTVLYGDPDLFVDWPHVPATAPVLGSTKWASQSSSMRDVITVDKSSLKAGVNTYQIMVFSYVTPSKYRLAVTTSSAYLVLHDGMPQQTSVARASTDFFKFVVPAPAASASATAPRALTITVTPLSGDPDLYVSTSNPRPRHNVPGSYSYSGIAFGGDSVTLPPSAVPAGATVYISVFGFNGASFTITASLSAPITLVEGVPQAGYVARGALLYYLLETGAQHSNDITITATPLDGNVDLYISACSAPALSACPLPTGRGNYSWSSNSAWYSRESVTIWTTDPSFLSSAAGRYIIAVSGVTAANFTLVGSSSPLTTLQEGVPLMGTVGQRMYQYYQLHVSDPSADVVIDVTPYSGDPDIFLSCSLNATADDAGTPSRKHYSFRSRFYGADTIAVHHNNPLSCSYRRAGTFYLAVYGYRNATFSVMATYSNSTRTLLDGVPQAGLVEAERFVQYRLYVGPDATSDITVTVAATHGDPDLYCTSDGQTPSNSHYQFTSRSYQTRDAITIRSTNPLMCRDCFLRCAVYGFRTAAFTITASSSRAQVVLQEGVPVRQHLQQSHYAFYRFFVSQPGSNLTVTLTPLSGDPDVIVSSLFPFPTLANVGNHTVWSAHQGLTTDSVLLTSVPSGDYYISAFAFSNSSYTITAHASAPGVPSTLRRLSDGVPQAGSVNARQFVYYQLVTGRDATDVDIVVTPASGVVGLYVNPCTGRWNQCGGGGSGGGSDVRPRASLSPSFGATWTSDASLSRERVRIPRSDSRSCSRGTPAPPGAAGGGCSYVIAVYGHSVSEFTLTAVTSAGTVELQDGVPVRGSVSRGEYAYYLVATSNVTYDLTVTLTPFFGDPDLVASTYPTLHPTIAHHTWSRRAYGADLLVIESSDPHACRCMYYVGVYGMSNSSFTILASLNNNRPVTLVDGTPQTGAVAAGGEQQYSLLLTQRSKDVTISLTPRFGNPDLYITLDGRRPTTRHYNRHSASHGTDVVRLSHTSYAFWRLCRPVARVSHWSCAVRIMVHGSGATASEYTLAVSSSAVATELRNNRPRGGVVSQGEWEHYKFTEFDSVGDMRVAITSYTGWVTVFISTSVPLIDSTTAFTAAVPWRSSHNTSGVGIVTISHNDPRRCAAPCNYYIAVYGHRLTPFNIMASTNYESSVAVLADGVPQAGVVPYRTLRYYRFTLPPNSAELDIVVSTVRGGVYFMVTNELDSQHQLVKPSIASNRLVHFRWGSWRSPSRDRVTIRAGQRFFAAGDYMIAVLGRQLSRTRNGGSTFTITATTARGTTTLIAGHPTQDSVRPRQYEYFRVGVSQPGVDLRIVLTAFSGDPDLYVSLPPDTRPSRSRGHYQWHSSSSGGSDRVVIQNAMQGCGNSNSSSGSSSSGSTVQVCYYYIAVYGYRNASFSLVAQTSQGVNSAVLLSDGVPQSGFVNASQYDYYTMQVDTTVAAGQPQQRITVALTPAFGDPDLYILLVAPGSTQVPGKAHFHYSSQHWSGSDSVTVNPGDAHYCSRCELRIAVYGYATVSSFTLLAATSNAATRLRNGQPQRATVSQASYNYYTFGVDRPDADVTISVTALTGDPDVYASVYASASGQPGRMPSRARGGHTWRSSRMGTDTIRISHTDAHFCSHCTYAIAVYGFSQSSYTITVTSAVDTVVALAVGVPQQGAVAAASWRYYSVALPDSAADLTLTVTPLSGNPDLYVIAATPQHTLPTKSNARWRSSSARSGSLDSVVIRAPHSVGRYIIGVYGTAAARYSLTAVLRSHWIYLQTGVPQRHFVAAQHMERFLFVPSAPSCDVSFSVLALNGDPDLLVSTSAAFPHCDAVGPYRLHCSNYTWAMTAYRSDVLNISHATPCANAQRTRVNGNPTPCLPSAYRGGPFFVGVWGSAATNFTITASLACPDVPQVVQLVAGTPSVAMTASHHVCGQRTAQSVCSPLTTTITAQSAFFSLSIAQAAADAPANSHVSFTVAPRCRDATSCDRLSYFVTSCQRGSCSTSQRFPSVFNNQVSAHAHMGSRTIFIAHDPSNPNNGYCDNSAADCVYYIGLFSGGTTAVTFTLTASTPSGWDIIPHVDASSSGTASAASALQNVAVRGPTTVQSASPARYEAFASTTQALELQVETCSGSPTLYICDSSCTNLDTLGANNYKWSASPSQACVRQNSGTNGGGGTAQCKDDTTQTVLLSHVEQDTYFLSVAAPPATSSSSSASYKLRVTTGPLLRRLVVPSPQLTLTHPGTADMSLGFQPALLLEKGKTTSSAAIHYKAYAVMTSDMGADSVITTPCGLDALARSTGKLPTGLAAAGTHSVSHDLAVSTSYQFNVVAECDAACLNAPGAATQRVAYTVTARITTNADLSPPSVVSTAAIVGLLLGVVTLLGCGVLAYLLYRRNKLLESQLQYEMSDVRNVARVTVSRRPARGTYSNVLGEEEEESGVNGATSLLSDVQGGNSSAPAFQPEAGGGRMSLGNRIKAGLRS